MSEYVDASVVGKWFKQDEDLRDKAIQLRSHIANFDDEYIMSVHTSLQKV